MHYTSINPWNVGLPHATIRCMSASPDGSTNPELDALSGHAWIAAGMLDERGVPVLVLDGSATNDHKSIKLLVSENGVREAVPVLERLSWRYSWVRTGVLRLLPMEYYWWDGGTELELYWGCPAAPMPSASLNALTRELWAGAARGADGLLRPDPAALLVFYAVQACRPGQGHQRDWETFVRLYSEIEDPRPAQAIARRVGTYRGLARSLSAARAGSGRPGRGPLFDGSLGILWRLANSFQSRVRPRRVGRLLAGTPSLGDATVRCRVRGVEVLAGPGVFVPTPDADIFVDMAADRLKSNPAPVILELGTGCGAIALALAHARPDAEVHATDLSEPAILSAQRNARTLGLERVRFHTGSLLEPVPDVLHGRVNVIAANLPFYPPRDYAPIGSVPRDTIQGMDEDGLGLVRQLAREAPRFLRPDGTLILQMFVWQWERLAGELAQLGYRAGQPRLSGAFAIGPAQVASTAPQSTPGSRTRPP
jgi:methylase of polypeptide subunit release factors